MKAVVVVLALICVFVEVSAASALSRTDDTNLKSGAEAAGRTFGGPRKRLLLLLPIVYKLGVISTLLGVLVALAVKSLAVGLLLLGLGAANLAAVSKLKAQSGGWSGGVSGHPGGVPIHLHVHGGGSHQAYSGWEPAPSGPHSHYTEHYKRR